MVGWKRHLAAATGMLVGSSVVFVFVLVMNSYTSPPPREEREAAAAFQVEKKKKPKAKRKRPKSKRRRAQRSAPQHAPAPKLSSAISGVSIDLPGFDSSQLGAISEDVLGKTSKKMVMDENSVDHPPKAVSRVAPSEYPKKARKQGITGYVTMNLLIGLSGEVERIKVLDAEPQGVFEEVAVSTIRKWRFAPAEYQAEHVKAWARQTMRFELN